MKQVCTEKRTEHKPTPLQEVAGTNLGSPVTGQPKNEARTQLSYAEKQFMGFVGRHAVLAQLSPNNTEANLTVGKYDVSAGNLCGIAISNLLVKSFDYVDISDGPKTQADGSTNTISIVKAYVGTGGQEQKFISLDHEVGERFNQLYLSVGESDGFPLLASHIDQGYFLETVVNELLAIEEAGGLTLRTS